MLGEAFFCEVTFRVNIIFMEIWLTWGNFIPLLGAVNNVYVKGRYSDM